MNEFQGKKYVQELWLNEVLHRSELQSSYDDGLAEERVLDLMREK